MYDLAFVADVHVSNARQFGGDLRAGVNRRAELTLEVLQRAVGRACLRMSSAGRFVVLGDLFDGVRPEPQLIARVAQILKGAPNPTVLLGNHEQVSTTLGDNSLAPLAEAGITVVESARRFPVGGGELVLVPFFPGPASEWLPQVLAGRAQSRAGHSILGLHLGLIRGDTPFYLRGSPDAIDAEKLLELCGEHGFEAVVAGNWHERWEARFAPDGKPSVLMCQVGALVPTDFRNRGIHQYGTVAFWRASDGGFYRSSIPGPRFLAFPGSLIRAGHLEEMFPEWEGHKVYLRVTEEPELLADMQQYLDSLCARDVLEAYELSPDAAGATAQARVAARKAGEASSIETSLEAFVAEMALASDVERGELLQKVRELLKRRA